MKYSEKLRDPRWQKKRLEIMERDGFSCRRCRGASQTLNVHHLYYEDGKNPWDYPDASLVTLCEDCHGVEPADRDNLEVILIHKLKECGFITNDLYKFCAVLLTCPEEFRSFVSKPPAELHFIRIPCIPSEWQE